MAVGEINKALDGFAHLVDSLHGGYGVALPLKAFTLSPDSPELAHGLGSRATSVHASRIAAEDEDLIGLERFNTVWRHPIAIILTGHLLLATDHRLTVHLSPILTIHSVHLLIVGTT